MRRLLTTLLLAALSTAAHGADAAPAVLLRDLDAQVIIRGKVRQPPLASMLARDVEARLRSANRTDRLAWEKVQTRADWERFRDVRLQALRASLGPFPAVPRDLKIRITRRLQGDGYHVDNLVFESRPGLVVTANLYRPAQPASSMPGILISHSHHQAKNTGARQDMAMTWARAGCLVLVPDHLGHGERRQHPFGDGGLHDYHGRYDTGMQLHLIGESLMGWLVWDLMRGVDVLLAQKGIDPRRIMLISEPAGGGDVAAVAAALDTRITGVMVNNFGGPQPETSFPLPRDAELSFNYAGSGSWESTRNLRMSARDGFLPWVIVAAAAPRRLMYYHEFYWDREQDPVWKRLRGVYEHYHSAESLVGLAGWGFVVGSPPENTHWLPVSREILYPTLERWFSIPNPKKEFSNRRKEEDLLCLTREVSEELKSQPLHALTAQLGGARSAVARKELAQLEPPQRRERLRRDWARLLGDVVPLADPSVLELPLERQRLGQVTVARLQLAVEPGIVVPVLLLLPPSAKGDRPPVVVGVAQEGKQEFLRRRAEPIAELLTAGVAICLPDLRGTGETSPGEGRDRRSAATNLSAGEWMLGQSHLGGRLRDLRAVLRHLRQRPELDGRRIALWGDSFAGANPPDRGLNVPHSATNRPSPSEPLGGLVALLGALFEDEVRAAYVHGGLSSYHSVLQGPLCYLPHDVVVPGVLTVGDLGDVAAALAPRPLWLDGLVDGLNREVPAALLAQSYEPAHKAFAEASVPKKLRIGQKPGEPSIARWFLDSLRD